MDTRILRFFIAVYENQSLTKAASACFVSQPNISAGIKQLEEELNKALFIRSAKGAVPTTEATYLYPVAKRLCHELEKLPKMFREEAHKHNITLGIADALPLTYQAAFIKSAQTVLKSVQWTVNSEIGPENELNLLVREFKQDDDLFLPLWKEDYVLCIPDKHPLLEKEVIDLQTDLQGELFLHCPACEAHGQCISILSAANQSFRTVANCESKMHLLAFLMAGVGLTFLPSKLVTNGHGFEVRPYIGPCYFREVGLAYPQRSLQNESIKQLLEYLSKHELRLS